ncbi:MAG TPA: winged helix DNA-binding protein [Candidatus Methanofastidiosa archaeon]|nr:winged helix DNA-binding protein [Candidatus Methanofastidiosa archaeon]HPR42161.1 winged helix DNA-binding protein [Candidatus Methanofastidiosa archaeon]
MNNLLIDDMAKDPQSRSLGRIISAICRYSRLYLTSELRDHDLMVIPLYILHSLSNDSWVKQEDLILQHGVDKAVMTRALAKLQRKKYIEKIQDPGDRRAFLVRLTDRGFNLKVQTRDILQVFNEQILRDFNEDETKMLFDFLDRLLINSIRSLEERG